jgi:5'-3' exonuclease
MEQISSYRLFIDTSYLVFYRIYAIKAWYGRAYPDTILTDPTLDPIFMEKYDALFFKNIHKLMKDNKYNIPTCDWIFALDCARCNIWRYPLFPEYKENRDITRKDDVFILENIFRHTYNNILPQFCEKNGSTLIKVDHAEADDIIAVSTKYCISHIPDIHIVIIANDHDYLQLLGNKNNTKTKKEKEALDFFLNLINANDSVSETSKSNTQTITIVNLQNKKLNDKSIGNDLLYKILLGDPADNIPPSFKKCGKATVKKLLDDVIILLALEDIKKSVG